jgi:hypothetical protein
MVGAMVVGATVGAEVDVDVVSTGNVSLTSGPPVVVELQLTIASAAIETNARLELIVLQDIWDRNPDGLSETAEWVPTSP